MLVHIVDFHLSTTIVMEEKWRVWYFFVAKSILWKIFIKNKTGLGHLNKTKVTGPWESENTSFHSTGVLIKSNGLFTGGNQEPAQLRWHKALKVVRKQPWKNYFLAISEGQNTTNKSNLKPLIVKIIGFSMSSTKNE